MGMDSRRIYHDLSGMLSRPDLATNLSQVHDAASHTIWARGHAGTDRRFYPRSSLLTTHRIHSGQKLTHSSSTGASLMTLVHLSHGATKRRRELQFDAFRKFIRSLHRNSLLVEYVMAAKGREVSLCPYHGHAIHDVETKQETVLVGRPAIIARNTRAVFSSEIATLERLLNDPTTNERKIQLFLEQYPNFLRGLNYQNIYPQLVLERDQNGSLIPDFILEPFEGGFCDILDIKLPSQTLYVGGKDRGQLAAGLHAVAETSGVRCLLRRGTTPQVCSRKVWTEGVPTAARSRHWSRHEKDDRRAVPQSDYRLRQSSIHNFRRVDPPRKEQAVDLTIDPRCCGKKRPHLRRSGTRRIRGGNRRTSSVRTRPRSGPLRRRRAHPTLSLGRMER